MMDFQGKWAREKANGKHDPLKYGGNKETEEWIRQTNEEIKKSSIKQALREVYGKDEH